MNRNDPVLSEYRQAADAVRCGDESVAALDRVAKAESACDAKISDERRHGSTSRPGSRNRDVESICWTDPSKYVERFGKD